MRAYKMPATDLFPRDDEPVVIKQGAVGSCYLLAGLDCVLNSAGKEGRALVKEQFEQYPDGAVRVRIRRNQHSAHIDPLRLGARYVVDQRDPNFDYWYIPKEKIAEIEKDSALEVNTGRQGVASNSLAVKIIERLSTFYFVTGGGVVPGATVLAHNVINNGSNQRYQGSPTGFLSDLLGVHADNLMGAHIEVRTSENIDRNIEQVIKLKTINPDAPVYIDMNWGEVVAGLNHAAHALRVEKITPDGKGSYIFHLKNPWYTHEKAKEYSLAELKSRNPWFSHFSLNSKQAELTSTILQCHVNAGTYIYKKPDLFKTLLALQDKAPFFAKSSAVIQNITYQHQNNRHLFPTIEKLLTDPKQIARLTTCIHSNAHDAKQFEKELMRLVVSNQPSPNLISVIPIAKCAPILLSLAIDAKKNKNTPEAAYLSSMPFLGLITYGAIIQAPHYTGKNYVDVKKDIEQELVNYYFTGSTKSLSNAYLKDYFDKEIGPPSFIAQMLSPEVFASKMISFSIGNYGPIPQTLTERIKNMPVDSLVTKEKFLNDFFTKERCSKPKELFEDLQKINALNPQLGKHLALSARQKMEEYSPGSFEKFSKEPVAATIPLFASSFIGLSDTQKSAAVAKEIVKFMINIINAMPVEYPANVRSSIAVVNNHSAGLQANLQKLLASPEYEKAKKTLGLAANPPEVDKALNDKMAMISAGAKSLNDARGVISDCVNRIKGLPVNNQSLEAMGRASIDLGNILNEAPYAQAKILLGLTIDPPEITEAFNNKSKAISDAYNLGIRDQKREVIQLVEKEASKPIEKVKNSAPIGALMASFADPFNEGALSQGEITQLYEKIKQNLEQQAVATSTKYKARLFVVTHIKEVDQHFKGLDKVIEKLPKEQTGTPHFQTAKSLIERFKAAEAKLLATGDLTTFTTECTNATKLAFPLFEKHPAYQDFVKVLRDTLPSIDALKAGPANIKEYADDIRTNLGMK